MGLKIFEEDGITFLSCSLARILYNMDDFSGNEIVNVGDDAPNGNAVMYSANHVYLNGVDQSVDLPIIHDVDVNGVITIPSNSYATRYDVDTKQFIQVANEADRDATTIENVVNGDFSDGDTGWTIIRGTTSVVNGKAQVTRTSSVSYGEIRQFPKTKTNFSIKGEYYRGTSVNENEFRFVGLYGGIDNNILLADTDGVFEKTFNALEPIARAEFRVYADVGTYNIVDNISVKEVLPISTHYKMTTAFSQYFTHTKALPQADLDALNNDNQLLLDVWFNGAVLPSGFNKSNMVNYIPANEGVIASDTLYDLKDLSTTRIQNYTDTCRTIYTNQNFGLQNFFAEKDTLGRDVGVVSNGEIAGENDGRFIAISNVGDQPVWDNFTKLKYDGDEVIITTKDNI